MTKWKERTLGEVIGLQRGYDLTADDRSEGQVPVMGAAGHNGYHNEIKVNAPGIVVGRSGGSFGQVHFCEKGFWPHNTAMFVTDFKGNDPYFVFYLLKLLNFDSLNSGSAQPSLNRNYLYPVKAMVPDPSEQKRVVNVIRKIDQKIALNNQINAELEAMAKLIFDYWFVQFDFPDENGKPYKSSGGKMVWCDQFKRDTPKGWETGALSDFGKIVGGSTPSKGNDANFASKGIPWITPNDLSNNVGNNFISRGHTDVSEAGRKSASLRLLPAGWVLLSSRAPIGYMAIARNPMTINQGFKSFVPTDRFPTAFIFFAVKRLIPSILRNANGSTFKEISGGTLGLVKTSMPDEAIVNEFCKKVQPMLDMQDTLETQNQELIKLRDWLLPMLMNGQVTVVTSENTG